MRFYSILNPKGLLWMILFVWLAACNSSPDALEPTGEAVTLPTFPPNFTIATATPLPLPLAQNDPRFPILPDEAGQVLYATYCAECHGIKGEGQNPANPYALDENGLAVAPPHNNTGHTWHHPDQQNFLVVWSGLQTKGFNPMPSFSGKLSTEEIIQILAYIKTWWGEEELQTQLESTRSRLNQ